MPKTATIKQGMVKIGTMTEDKIEITLVPVKEEDLTSEHLSSSGKSYLLASTQGFLNLGNGVKLAVNLIKTV